MLNVSIFSQLTIDSSKPSSLTVVAHRLRRRLPRWSSLTVSIAVSHRGRRSPSLSLSLMVVVASRPLAKLPPINTSSSPPSPIKQQKPFESSCGGTSAKRHCSRKLSILSLEPITAGEAGLAIGEAHELPPRRPPGWAGAVTAREMEKAGTMDYINQMFPTEASLSGVEPLMQKIHSEIRVVDAEILAAVRQQSNSGTRAKEDLAAATRAVEVSQHSIFCWQLRTILLFPFPLTLLFP
ncbi:Vps53-like, N-terminal [Cynara cardunculus var. scolymus]|uniref:Vps53-like, N-terminal n=1 Tax=Cynara cardunculus var. scolymus TaxID=59895 RepID=A0A103XI17_CYNCS|nr:Vps53-like, N-terminal [Cynara cardunculus var. scolymus]